MPDDIDSIADSLGAVKADDDLGTVPISSVAVDDATVRVTVRLPSGTSFTDEFTRPPVWGPNCDLKRLLDAFDLGPDEIADLDGEDVPVTRSVVDGTLSLAVDMDALTE